MNQAFQDYLTPGTPTFVEKPLPDGLEVINVVHEAGGIVVLAHPGHHMPHSVAMKLISDGLDGIEVIHPSHDHMLENYYRSLAADHGLMVSGGSDFHGRTGYGMPLLGDIWIEPDQSIISLARP